MVGGREVVVRSLSGVLLLWVVWFFVVVDESWIVCVVVVGVFFRAVWVVWGDG
jgi:hypothetical protein